MSEKYDIQVGDRVTYMLDGEETSQLIISDMQLELTKDAIKVGRKKILKIERPKYEKVYGKQEILDEAEKEYLSNVIKPFRNKVRYIKKNANFNVGRKHFYEFLSISMPGEDSFDLPYFETNTMYRGMELAKPYTLKELGLDK